MSPQAEKERLAFRVLDVILTITCAIILGLASWNGKTTIDHGNRITAIEANRFTASDGLAIWQEIAGIREQVAALPTEIPPEWFVREVEELKATVRSIDERLRRMETQANHRND